MSEAVGAVIVHNDDRGLGVEYRPVPRPTPQPGTILVRPAVVGVCGSDLELLSGALDQQFKIRYPHILGHEWAGTVEQGGTRFQPGDRVIGLGDLGGNQWFGVTTDGAMADVFAVPESLCLPVPANVGDRTAALIEPFACMLNAVQLIGGVDASHTVAVFGCGALGMSAVALARQAGAAVVALDPSPLRRDTAWTSAPA